jgi:hypothetical protein
MSGDRRSRPAVEPLEGRQLLSGGAYTASPTSSHPHPLVPPADAQVLLTGPIKGVLLSKPGMPDTGQQYQLSASGRIQPAGLVAAFGKLQTPGFINSALTTGTITLSSRQGSLSVKLTSDPQDGFSQLPEVFTYQIVHGSGHFLGATGGGTVLLTIQYPTDVQAVPGMHQGLGTGSVNRFTMTFGSVPPTS